MDQMRGYRVHEDDFLAEFLADPHLVTPPQQFLGANGAAVVLSQTDRVTTNSYVISANFLSIASPTRWLFSG